MRTIDPVGLAATLLGAAQDVMNTGTEEPMPVVIYGQTYQGHTMHASIDHNLDVAECLTDFMHALVVQEGVQCRWLMLLADTLMEFVDEEGVAAAPSEALQATVVRADDQDCIVVQPYQRFPGGILWGERLFIHGPTDGGLISIMRTAFVFRN